MSLVGLPLWFEIPFVFVFGLALGSFATVLNYRIPREIPLGLFSHTRSRCTSCDQVIPWYRNIPLFSFLRQGGKCAMCGAKISKIYPIIELTTASLLTLSFVVYANSPNQPIEGWARWAELFKVLYFTFALVVTTFIDLEHRIIPDRFSFGGWILALGAAALWGVPDIYSSLAGGIFGAGSFWFMAWAYEKWKGVEGLGFGDVKMMGWLGSWIGFFGVPWIILVGSLSGLVVGLIAMRKSKDGMQTAIPFGPFLALGAYSAWIVWAMGWWFVADPAPI